MTLASVPRLILRRLVAREMVGFLWATMHEYPYLTGVYEYDHRRSSPVSLPFTEEVQSKPTPLLLRPLTGRPFISVGVRWRELVPRGHSTGAQIC